MTSLTEHFTLEELTRSDKARSLSIDNTAAKLKAARDDIAATLTERENLIESLQHDNATIRSWADAPLPDAIARLRDRPATTGVDNLPQRLPGSSTLPVAGGSAQD